MQAIPRYYCRTKLCTSKRGNSSSCLPSLSWGRGGGLYPHRFKPGNRTQTPTPISLSKDHPHRAELHGRATVVLLTTTNCKSITKKSYSATIDHPAIESSSIKALPCLPHTSSDGRFQRENSLSKKFSSFRRHLHIQVTKHMPQIDMLPRPGAARLPAWAERVGNGRLQQKGLLKPFRLPCRRSVCQLCIIIRVSRPVRATTKSRPARESNLFASRLLILSWALRQCPN
jgi:hypothetical protein